MQPVALRIIREEHTAIAAILHSLEYLLQKLQEGGEPNFLLLHAMLEYIAEYPEQVHHPKENNYLFRTLRLRNANVIPLVDELEAEHERGDALLKDVVGTLARYEARGKAELPAFVNSVTSFVEFQWQHMIREEDVLLPIAKKSLTDADWKEIADAFLKNDNPLLGLDAKAHFSQLLDRILKLASKPSRPPEGSNRRSNNAG